MKTIHTAINNLPKAAQAEFNQFVLRLAAQHGQNCLSSASGQRLVYDFRPKAPQPDGPTVVRLPSRPRHEHPLPPAA